MDYTNLSFQELVDLLRPRYGAQAPAIARQLVLARRNFGTTTIRRVTV